MSHVIFSHTKSREKKYQQKILSQKQWFIDHDFPVFLPQNTNRDNSDKDYKAVKNKLYKLQKKWDKIESDYFKIISSFKHSKLLPKYISHITLYGPEGEFQAPNILYVRLRTTKDKKMILEAIGHELIHICLGKFFEKQNLSYEEIEWLVDNLILQSNLKKLFPNYKQQTIGKPRKNILMEILN
ncbi:MAG: hypothetical protein COV57_01725 [Candidatus Liptonbacteria bacterium CG11_big_fil_rev_8_21_14_0_20_35_14]|uniref:Uncharacterized protein n=1 Tax=Candidatus Liptonbacteria bacterium CG11_big_fil_rev_8_21_14_0_20_35_14 TaxID=1974634 RepID=A0A2H0N7U5_9BACT|nr:MAG: hypothetical protein COV57_01725 [Candidatus Liptonbacteria bacterium CG11_big_fil_rev_8_21_14_0_20_35_14]